MRQELLGKQEKTQKSIKRLVDFIKLIQHRPESPQPLQAAPSTSCHPQPTSSPSLRQSPSLQSHLTPPAILSLVPAAAQSPTIHSSSTSPVKISLIPGPQSPTIITCPPSQQLQLTKRQLPNNNTSSLKKYPTPASVVLSVTQLNNQFNRLSAINCRVLNLEKDIKISQNRHPSSTITSPVVSPPSQPFELTKSPQPAPFLDSIPSHPRKSLTSNQPVYHQKNVDNDVNPTSVESALLIPPKSNSHCELEIPKSKKIKNWKQTNNVRNLVYSTHCSQAITSPISSPIVVINRREETIVSNQDRTSPTGVENT